MKVNTRFLFVTLIALIGVGGLFFAELAHAVEPQQTTMAQTSTGQAGALTSDGQGLVLQSQDRILARIWGLTDDEMQRAQLLLRGPRAAFSVANLTPIEALGIRRLATNSGKAAFYAPGHSHVDVRFGTLEQCLETAVTGRWPGG